MRQLLGYQRLDDPDMVEPINVIYREIWERLHNHFCPSAKLLSKDRHGAKLKRRHDQPTTPCDRLPASAALSARQKARLRTTRQSLNPFELHRRLEAAQQQHSTPKARCHDF